MVQKTDNGIVTNYTHNVEDRLTEVGDGSGSLMASYYYDPFDRRLWKEVDGVRTYFLYSDEGLIGEYDSGGVEIRSYGYVPGSTWTTDPLFMKEGENYYFYQNDHLGTPMQMTGVNGAVVWSAKYSSFGEADVEAVSGITSNLRFAGQYYDQETGLHYNYLRTYNPALGRYVTPDPSHQLHAKGDNIPYLLPTLLTTPQELNRYFYVNNPINLVDPVGLKTPKECERDCYIGYSLCVGGVIGGSLTCAVLCSFARPPANAICIAGCFIMEYEGIKKCADVLETCLVVCVWTCDW